MSEQKQEEEQVKEEQQEREEEGQEGEQEIVEVGQEDGDMQETSSKEAETEEKGEEKEEGKGKESSEAEEEEEEEKGERPMVGEESTEENVCCRRCLAAHRKKGRNCVCCIPNSERRSDLGSLGCRSCGCMGCNPVDQRKRYADGETRFMFGTRNNFVGSLARMGRGGSSSHTSHSGRDGRDTRDGRDGGSRSSVMGGGRYDSYAPSRGRSPPPPPARESQQREPYYESRLDRHSASASRYERDDSRDRDRGGYDRYDAYTGSSTSSSSSGGSRSDPYYEEERDTRRYSPLPARDSYDAGSSRRGSSPVPAAVPAYETSSSSSSSRGRDDRDLRDYAGRRSSRSPPPPRSPSPQQQGKVGRPGGMEMDRGCCRECMKAFSRTGRACHCQVPSRVRRSQIPRDGCRVCGCFGCNPEDVAAANGTVAPPKRNREQFEERYEAGDPYERDHHHHHHHHQQHHRSSSSSSDHSDRYDRYDEQDYKRSRR